MKPIVIIGAWINTFEKEQELIDLCARLKSKYDVCVSSHYPIPQSIQNQCRFTLFDSNNELVSQSLLPKGEFSAWIDNPQVYCRFRAEAIYSLYTYAVFLLIKNPLLLAKMYGYDTFIYLESDFLIHEKDIYLIDKYLEEMISNRKKCLFNNFNEDFVSTGFFISEIDHFLSLITNFESADEYAKFALENFNSILLENYFYWLFINDQCLVKNIKSMQDMFPNSIIDKYSNNSADRNPIMYDIVYDKKDKDLLYFVCFNLHFGKDSKYYAVIKSEKEEIEVKLTGYFNWSRVSGEIFYLEIKNYSNYKFHLSKCIQKKNIYNEQYYIDFK